MLKYYSDACETLSTPSNSKLSCLPSDYSDETAATCLVVCNDGYEVSETLE